MLQIRENDFDVIATCFAPHPLAQDVWEWIDSLEW